MLKPLVITHKENSAGKSEKAAKKGLPELVKNSKQKHLNAKNNKINAFARLLQDKQHTSLKQAAAGAGSLQETLAAVLKNLQKASGTELSRADLEKIVEKLLNQKIGEQLKNLLKKSGLADEQQLSQVDSLLEKLRNKDKPGKHDLMQVLGQIGNLVSTSLQQAKKEMNQTRGKKETEPAGIPGKDSSSKEGNEPRIVVIDLRSKEQGARAAKQAKNIKHDSTRLKAPEMTDTEADSIGKEVKFFTSHNAGSRESGSSENGKTFQNTLSRYQGLSSTDLQKMSEILKNEIVRNTGIVLKTNNNGEIRLILKPETLGKVRINLNLENNRIDGKIFVENNIVREMMENSLQGLNHALMEEGFDAVSLHVSVNDGNRDNREETAAGNRRKEGTEEFEKNIPLAQEYNPDYSLVNLVI